MPRVGFGTADMSVGSAGVQAGNYEIVDAKCKIHQFPANRTTGVQSDPFTAAQIDFAPLDENGARKNEEPTSQYFRLGDVADWHPGNIDESEKDNLEADVEDMGDEVDSEGNTVYAVDPAKRLFAKMPWQMFTGSLEAQGFKPEILGKGYIPDLIGTKLELETVARDYKDKSGADKKGVDLLVKHIIERPYEKKAAPAKGKVVSKANGAAKAAPAPVVEDDDVDPVRAQAVTLITGVAATFEGKKPKRDEFQRQVLAAGMKAKNPSIPAKDQAKIINMIKNDNTLQELFLEAGLADAAVGISATNIQF